MKKIIGILLFIVLINSTVLAQSSLTPNQVLAKTVASITGSKAVEARFTINNSGYSGSGVIKTTADKFNVTLPDVEVWYNGKEMYTYNKGTSETTVVIPTIEELTESNPLAYVTEAAKKYNVVYSTVKKTGKYVLELTPKTKGEIKRITLTVKKENYHPEKIVVEPMRGNPITAEISSFKTGITLSSSEFDYPKTKYPKVEIIDLR